MLKPGWPQHCWPVVKCNQDTHFSGQNDASIAFAALAKHSAARVGRCCKMAEVIETESDFYTVFITATLSSSFFFFEYFFVCLDIVCKMVEVIGMESGFQTIFITAIFIFVLSLFFSLFMCLDIILER